MKQLTDGKNKTRERSTCEQSDSDTNRAIDLKSGSGWDTLRTHKAQIPANDFKGGRRLKRENGQWMKQRLVMGERQLPTY